MVVDVDGEEKLFFVVETKGSLFDDALRDAEVGKIMCGSEHFAAIAPTASAARFVRATSMGDFEKRWYGGEDRPPDHATAAAP